MSDPTRPAAALLTRSRLALWWERAWAALWPAVSAAAAFLALALFNLLPRLPTELHLALLAAWLIVFGTLLRAAAPALSWPSRDHGWRRLERDNRLSHRPLRAGADRLPEAAAADPLTLALWQHHQAHQTRQLQALRLGWPRPGVPARDPLALRALALLVLVVAATVSWGDWGNRLGAALVPDRSGPAPLAASLDLWLSPPQATGLAPLLLHPQQAGTSVSVPVGTSASVRVSGGRGVPELAANGTRQPLRQDGEDLYQLTLPLTTGERLAVFQDGRTLGQWPVTVTPDQPPSVSWSAPPAVTERRSLRLEADAADDYGLTAATLLVERQPLPGSEAAALPPPAELPLSLPTPASGGRPRQAHLSAYLDLTAHPWAGLPVTLTIRVDDGTGHQGHSAPATLVLPERAFSHPVARAIVAERRALIVRGEDARAEAAQRLSQLSSQPGSFRGDVTVFLALRAAVARLLLSRAEADALPSVVPLLWEVALRVEDGDLPATEQALRAAEQALANALQGQASAEELRQLTDQLEQALSRYLDSLDARSGANTPPSATAPPPGGGTELSRQDLEGLMEQLRQLTETGAREGASQALSQLRQLLESLRSGNGGENTADNPAWQLMQSLSQLTAQQRRLLEQTWQQARQAPDSTSSPGDRNLDQPPPPRRPPSRPQPPQQQQPPAAAQPEGRAAEQEQLRRQLNQLMQSLGDLGGTIPQPFGAADRAMNEAAQALRQGRPDSAAQAQTRAVDQLQQGLRGLAEQLAQQGMGAAGGGGGAPGRDPLGRPSRGPGGFDSGGQPLPDQSELRRAREILDELRRRAGQSQRPRFELDYLERLLRQF